MITMFNLRTGLVYSEFDSISVVKTIKYYKLITSSLKDAFFLETMLSFATRFIVLYVFR